MRSDYNFSVIIPVFNRRHLISRAVDSVLSQTYPADEIIIVDDGSTDDLAGLIDKKYAAHPEVRYVRQDNQGSGRARNCGVAEAHSQWIAFLDSDDEWYAFRLERIVEALELAEDLDALATAMDTNVRTTEKKPTSLPVAAEPYTLERFLIEHGTSSCSCIVMRRERFLRLGGFSRPNNDNEDHDLILRLLSAGGKFSVLRENLGLLHTEESRHTANLDWWYGLVFTFWRESYRQYGLRGLKKRRAFSSLYLDCSISAQEKGCYVRSLRYLVLSFVWMPVPIKLRRYGIWLRYRRLLRSLVSRCLWSALWHVVVLRRRLIAARLSRGSVLLTTPQGLRMRVNYNEFVGNEIIHDSFAPVIKDLVLGLLCDGGTAVDVGGNIGYTALLAGKAVGSTGKVYVFEPVSSTYRCLVENIRLNRLVQIVPRRVALTDHDGEIMLYLGDEKNRGTSSVSTPVNHSGETERCYCTTLDVVVRELGLKIDFMKVDIEGAEPLFLRGAVVTLKTAPPPVMVMECSVVHLARLGFTPRDVHQALLKAGYSLYHIDERKKGLIPHSVQEHSALSSDLVALQLDALSKRQCRFLEDNYGLFGQPSVI